MLVYNVRKIIHHNRLPTPEQGNGNITLKYKDYAMELLNEIWLVPRNDFGYCLRFFAR